MPGVLAPDVTPGGVDVRAGQGARVVAPGPAKGLSLTALQVDATGRFGLGVPNERREGHGRAEAHDNVYVVAQHGLPVDVNPAALGGLKHGAGDT